MHFLKNLSDILDFKFYFKKVKPILNGQIITFSELDKLIQKKEISTEEAEKFFSAYNEVVSELTRGQNQVKNVIRQSILVNRN